jgi:uncharacterized repeat protein (TIGR03803 family)
MKITLSGGKNAYAVFLLLATATIVSSAQTFTTLVNFNGSNGTGASNPIQGFDGNYYGITAGGGANCPQGSTCGTIYRLTPGKLITIYTFCLQTGCPDGSGPIAVIQARDGNLYGTTGRGGANDGGTFFRLGLSGKLTTLYSFCAPSSCGYYGNVPGALMQGADGNFYGATSSGGAYGYGSIVKITSSGTLTTVYDFSNATGGVGSLIQATNGNLYGTTLAGGYLNCDYGFGVTGCGTVFELTSKGRFLTLYGFCRNFFPCADGAMPEGSLIQGADGDLYGTTYYGGFNNANSGCDYVGCGAIFKFTLQGQMTTLYKFCIQADCPDGFWPGAGLTLGSDGNFYGSASSGGLYVGICELGCGTLFSVTPDGTFNTLHSFDSVDGLYPQAVTQATNGTFVGATTNGGADNYGTLYSLSMNLPAFVKTNPVSGKVGTPVVIMGNNLTGSTAVTFNGTLARFRVATKGAIVAVVPTGATSGLVTVTGPGGTLTSNAVFTVRP